MQHAAIHVQYRDLDGKALPYALRNGAIALKALQHPVQVLQLPTWYSQLQRGLHAQHAHAVFSITPHISSDCAAQRVWVLLELARRKQQRVAQAVTHGRTQ